MRLTARSNPFTKQLERVGANGDILFIFAIIPPPFIFAVFEEPHVYLSKDGGCE